MRMTAVVLALTSCLSAGAMAAPPAGSVQSPQSRYQLERAECLSGDSAESRSDCLREAGAARNERGKLASGETEAQYARNQTLRCEPLPVPYREACLARMSGQGTTSGSVEGGGILRELTVIEVGTPPPAR